jgi:hypothetical protein
MEQGNTPPSTDVGRPAFVVRPRPTPRGVIRAVVLSDAAASPPAAERIIRPVHSRTQSQRPRDLSVFRRLAMAIAERNRKIAHINADPEVLVIEDVARMLRCAIDTAKRIPRNELPSCRSPGRRVLYLRSDVLNYLRSRRASAIGANADLLMRDITAEALESRVDRVRERSRRRTS